MTPAPLSDVAGTTAGPWHWEIHDVSMASLCGPDGERDHVLSVSPCKSCQDGKDEWAWRRCTVPNEADADLLVAAPDLYEALDAMVAAFGEDGFGIAVVPNPCQRLALEAARAALSRAASRPTTSGEPT